MSFTFRVNDITSENKGSTVTMMHNTEKAQHTQRFYNHLHVVRWAKKELNKSVKETPNSTAAAAIAGIDPATGAIKRSIKNINKVLEKYGCATFEINRSKIGQGIILSENNVVAAFEDLEKHYDSAQILSSKLFVSFCSPETIKSESPFADQSIITNVTYKTATDKDDSERGLPRIDSDGFDDHPENGDYHSEQEDLLYSISNNGKRFCSAVSSFEDTPECLKNPLHMQSPWVYL
ncbi:hypothetical protein PS6_007729 [Mucor atramentarius]